MHITFFTLCDSNIDTYVLKKLYFLCNSKDSVNTRMKPPGFTTSKVRSHLICRNNGKRPKHTRTEAAHAIQRLDFREDNCGINRYIHKRQNSAISKIMNM